MTQNEPADDVVDHDDLHDLLCTAIDDSMDMDWQSGWAADSIIAALEREGMVVSRPTEHVGEQADRDVVEAALEYGKQHFKPNRVAAQRGFREGAKWQAAIQATRPARDGAVGEAWRSPADTPVVDAESCCDFIVAVKRKHSERVFVFPAQYLRSFELHFNEEPYERRVNGWYLARSEDPDMGDTYYELLNEGDELLGWQNLPQWEALQATLSTTPQADALREWDISSLEATLGALEGKHGNGWINISMKERRLFAKLLRALTESQTDAEKAG